MERTIMSTHSKKAIKEIVLLSIGVAMLAGAIILGFVILADESTRLFTSPIFYPSSS
jgi:hypothetical protein